MARHREDGSLHTRFLACLDEPRPGKEPRLYPDLDTAVNGSMEAIANPLASIEDYDTVLLGSPIWNVRTPMIMSTFVEGFDFAGKAVFPFVTFAVSGLGTTMRDYAASCPGATLGEGLAVRGEEVADAAPSVEAWLRRIGLLT